MFSKTGATSKNVGKSASPVAGAAPGPSAPRNTRQDPQQTTKQAGDAAEELALRHLQSLGLTLLERNYRTPGRGGGEIDLIMREPDGTTVFVEVRRRATNTHGGAAGSVSFAKQRRIVFAARYYLLRLRDPPPCRFDVVSLGPDGLAWLKGAFDAS